MYQTGGGGDLIFQEGTVLHSLISLTVIIIIGGYSPISSFSRRNGLTGDPNLVIIKLSLMTKSYQINKTKQSIHR